MKINKLLCIVLISSSLYTCSKDENSSPPLEFPFENEDLRMTFVNALPNYHFRQIQFFDENHGLGLDYSGTIFITKDHFKNYESRALQGDIKYALDLEFYTENVGYVMTEEYGVNSESITIHRSRDGGLNWEIVQTEALSNGADLEVNSLGHIFWIHFNKIYRSTDEGEHWEMTKLPQDESIQMTNLEFNGAYGYCSGAEGSFYVSKDHGATWNQRDFPSENYVGPLSFLGESGYVKENFSNLYKTTDAGLTWDKISPENIEYFQNSIFEYLENSRILDCGSVTALPDGWTTKASIKYSKDEGMSWMKLNFDTYTGFNYFSFFSKEEAYMIADNHLLKLQLK